MTQSLVDRAVHRGALCPQGQNSGGNCTDMAHMMLGLTTVGKDAVMSYVVDRGPTMRIAKENSTPNPTWPSVRVLDTTLAPTGLSDHVGWAGVLFLLATMLLLLRHLRTPDYRTPNTRLDAHGR